MIPFNKPYLTGKEIHYIYDAVHSGKLSGNGKYTQMCQSWFEHKYGFGKCLLTTSCTDALEMAAILLNIEEGDEVILPSYTFVSTANAFLLRGAKLVFVDSRPDHPGMDESLVEGLITSRTKAIVPVHYAGVSCDMDLIMEIANRHKLLVVEDAAQAVDSYFTGSDGIRRALGSIGHLAAFSFHETKNVISGEGGMLVINEMKFASRAEIIWEKGTNRSSFFRGEVDKYGWVDVGSSFLPSELIAAFLWSQLENIDIIQAKRIELWNNYYEGLSDWGRLNYIGLPHIPHFATCNGHMFYLTCKDSAQRDKLIKYLKDHAIHSVFHYLSLSQSEYYLQFNGENLVEVPNSNRYTECLVRLPMYFELSSEEQKYIMDKLKEW